METRKITSADAVPTTVSEGNTFLIINTEIKSFDSIIEAMKHQAQQNLEIVNEICEKANQFEKEINIAR